MYQILLAVSGGLVSSINHGCELDRAQASRCWSVAGLVTGFLVDLISFNYLDGRGLAVAAAAMSIRLMCSLV